MSKFKDYHFREYINEALNEIHFTDPTLVQTKVLPKAIKRNSLMVESATGSGKTLIGELAGITEALKGKKFIFLTPLECTE